MAGTHSKVAKVWLDNTGGTPVDFTDYVSVTGIEVSYETADVTVIGSDGREHVVGIQDGGEIPLEGPLNTTVYNQLVGIVNGGVAVTFMIQPLGAGSGKPEISAEVNVTKLGFDSNPDDAAMIKGTLKVTGAVSLGTDS